MNIGIDFDNTIVNTCEVSKKYLDIFKPGNNLKSYHELPLEEEIAFFSKYHMEIAKHLKVLPNVKKAFAFFRKNNCKLYLITARGLNVDDQVKMVETIKEYLKNKKIKFEGEIYYQQYKSKACLENDIDIMIDDTDYVLEDVKKNGIRVLKYGNISDKYDYVLNWNEVIEYFRKEFKCE